MLGLSPGPTAHYPQSRAGHWPSLGLGALVSETQRESLRFFPASWNVVRVLCELLPGHSVCICLAWPLHTPTVPDTRSCTQQELDVLMRLLNKHDMAICMQL